MYNVHCTLYIVHCTDSHPLKIAILLCADNCTDSHPLKIAILLCADK